MKMKLVPMFVLLAGCTSQTKLTPLQQEQALIAVVNSHNVIAGCIMESKELKDVQACITKAFTPPPPPTPTPPPTPGATITPAPNTSKTVK